MVMFDDDDGCGVLPTELLSKCAWSCRSILLSVACLAAIVSSSRRQGSFSGQQRGNAAMDLKAEDTPKLGCVWDGTGCAQGCDAEAMEARCQRLSHDQEECETGEGETERY